MTPYFSVILPTKDRPALATDVVRHTLHQSFRDFELVVVDNGSDDQTSQAATGFGDPRVRIVRTGGLNMPDNWQAGLDAGRGEFVMMIEDKLFLVGDALERCAEILRETDSPLLSWMLGSCDGPRCPTLDPVGSCTVSNLPTADFLHYGRHCMIDRYHKQAPRGMNMVLRRDFVVQSQAKIGRLCRPMAPDYSMGALLLPFLDSFPHPNKVLSRILANGPTTGGDVWLRTDGAKTFFQSLGLSIPQLLEHVPVKIPFFQNLIVSDLFRFWRAAGIDHKKLSLHTGGYYMMLLSELLIAKNHGLSYFDDCHCIRAAFWKLPIRERIQFFPYAFQRFLNGWPDRKARLRVNAPSFAYAMKLLFPHVTQLCVG